MKSYNFGTKSIKAWPAAERPREKLQQQGAEALTDTELLALLLRTGNAASGATAVDIARSLLQNAGSLQALSRYSRRELCALPGLGPAKAAELQGAFELAQRLRQTPWLPGEAFTSPEAVAAHYVPLLEGRCQESFWALLLDNKHRLIKEQTISLGGLNSTVVQPREVFLGAIQEAAAAILVLHNHPSGDPTPSQDDIHLTQRLQEAGQLLGIKLLDHLVVGKQGYVSFKEQGLL